MRFFKWVCGWTLFEHFKLINEKTNHLHEKIECINRKTKMLLHAMENNRLMDKDL